MQPCHSREVEIPNPLYQLLINFDGQFFSKSRKTNCVFGKKKNCIHRIKLELNTLMKCNIDGSKCFLF